MKVMVETEDDLKFFKDRIPYDDAVKVLVEIGNLVGVGITSNDTGDRLWHIYYRVSELDREAKTLYQLKDIMKKVMK